MASPKPGRRAKHYTVAEANATLPLVRAIVKDVCDLANQMRERHERLRRVQSNPKASLGAAYQEEAEQMEAELERGSARMRELQEELGNLGVELKDLFIGLVDFRSMQDGREIYLCWRLGEPDVGHWHELDAGYAGRQRIMEKAARG